MKIVKNFLSDEDYQICYDDLVSKLVSDCWGYTKVTWRESAVTNGITGSVLSSLVSNHVYDLILDKFSSFIDVSTFTKIVMQYYVWQPYSGLSLHNDDGYKMASTIYLNQDWNVDYGGMFLWKESKEDEIFQAIPPIKGMMILNDQRQDHMVTPVSPLSPDLRVTIQTWFSNSD